MNISSAIGRPARHWGQLVHACSSMDRWLGSANSSVAALWYCAFTAVSLVGGVGLRAGDAGGGIRGCHRRVELEPSNVQVVRSLRHAPISGLSFPMQPVMAPPLLALQASLSEQRLRDSH